MGGRGRRPAKRHTDPGKDAVVSEWDRWVSRQLPTGYIATGDDEMRFFTHMQKNCSHIMPNGMDDPWRVVPEWLLLERRVKDQVTVTEPMRRRRGRLRNISRLVFDGLVFAR
jgi:hypothetical protein